MRYLGKKHGLFGKNLKEEAEIDMLIQTAEDIMLAFAQKAYDPNFVSCKVLNVYPFFRLADFAQYHCFSQSAVSLKRFFAWNSIAQKTKEIFEKTLPYEAGQ